MRSMLFLATLLTAPAFAAEPKPPQTYGADAPNCLEWTDGCVICRKLEDNDAACSTAGFACVAREIACLKPTNSER